MQLTIESLWSEILERLRMRLTRPAYETWLKPASVEAFDENQLTIQTSTPFARNWLQKHYAAAIAEAAHEVLGKSVEVSFTSSESSEDELRTAAMENVSPKAAPAPKSDFIIGTLNSKYVFSRFVVGATNRMAHAASLAVAEVPGKDFNPLFLCGGVGLGKTHLMQAIGHYRLEVNPQSKICYISTERFTNDLIEAINRNAMQAFRERYRKVDLLMIDDVQFLEGKEYTQEEFFHTFNVLHEDGKQIVLAADRPPHMISGLQDRLCSRFSMGLIADIQTPDLETRMAILQKKAEDEGNYIPKEVIQFIATTYTNNIRELEGALIRAIAYVSISGLPMRVETIRPILSPPQPKGEVTPNSVLEIVSEEMGIDLEELRGNSRKREISTARQICMYLLRSHTDLSLPKIGGILGGKDHTTVLYAIDKISELKSHDAQTTRLLQRISQRLISEAD